MRVYIYVCIDIYVYLYTHTEKVQNSKTNLLKNFCFYANMYEYSCG